MYPAVLFALGVAPQLIAARALKARSVSCAFDTAASSGDTCSSFASMWGMTETKFAALNPDITCPGDLVAGDNYCVIGTVTSDGSTTTAKTTSTTTSTTTTIKSTTTSATKVATTATTATTTVSSASNSPTQSGLAADCDQFHLVSSGDSCSGIEAQYDISTTDFATWNPSIDDSCSNLWLGYYVCVGVPGSASATSTTSVAATTSTAATSTGPSPQMPSIVSDCDKYYQVESGDGCYSIEQAQDITSDEFLAWNPSVGSDCLNLWLGYYVCVGV